VAWGGGTPDGARSLRWLPGLLRAHPRRLWTPWVPRRRAPVATMGRAPVRRRLRRVRARAVR